MPERAHLLAVTALGVIAAARLWLVALPPTAAADQSHQPRAALAKFRRAARAAVASSRLGFLARARLALAQLAPRMLGSRRSTLRLVGKAITATVRMRTIAHSHLEDHLHQQTPGAALRVEEAVAFYEEHQAACCVAGQLPLECFVNYALLLMTARRVVQFDLCFYSGAARQAVTEFVMEHCCGDGDNDDACVHAEMSQIDRDCNLVLYLAADHDAIRQKIDDVGGFGSTGYAHLLDEKFYSSRFDIREIYAQGGPLKQVSYAVAHGAHKGALLVQMLCPDELDCCRANLLARFEHYRHFVGLLSAGLACSFEERDAPT